MRYLSGMPPEGSGIHKGRVTKKWLFHVSDPRNANYVRRWGLIPTIWGKDQMSPQQIVDARKAGRRLWFGRTPGEAHTGALGGRRDAVRFFGDARELEVHPAQPIVYRVRRSDIPNITQAGMYPYTNRAIPPNRVEVWHSQKNRWISLMKALKKVKRPLI